MTKEPVFYNTQRLISENFGLTEERFSPSRERTAHIPDRSI